MSNTADSESDAESVDMRAEYDFSGGVRGRYAERHARGTNVVLLARTWPRSSATRNP